MINKKRDFYRAYKLRCDTPSERPAHTDKTLRYFRALVTLVVQRAAGLSHTIHRSWSTNTGFETGLTLLF